MRSQITAVRIPIFTLRRSEQLQSEPTCVAQETMICDELVESKETDSLRRKTILFQSVIVKSINVQLHFGRHCERAHEISQKEKNSSETK